MEWGFTEQAWLMGNPIEPSMYCGVQPSLFKSFIDQVPTMYQQIYYVPGPLAKLWRHGNSWAWCHITAILTLRRVRQEDCKVETSLGYIERPYSQGNSKKGKEEGEGKGGKRRGGTNRHCPHTDDPDVKFYRHRGNHTEPILDPPTGSHDLSTFPIE